MLKALKGLKGLKRLKALKRRGYGVRSQAILPPCRKCIITALSRDRPKEAAAV
jgi:hypothetical protein